MFVCLPLVSTDPAIQARYDAMRRAGESHAIAEILAVRKFPGVRTQATFDQGRCNGNQFERTPGLGNHHKAIADAAGVSITGKHYCSGLADFPGDPTAWISDKSDILRVAREKGYRVRGEVEYDPGEREPMPDVAIAPEIVEAAVAGCLAANPGQRRDDVEEHMTALLTGAIDDHPLLVADHPSE